MTVLCTSTLQWRHNEHDGDSNHQPHDCLLNRLFRRRSEKTSKLRVTGLCAGNSPGTCEFLAQMVSYAENVSIWWCHHAFTIDAVLTHSNCKKQTSLHTNFHDFFYFWLWQIFYVVYLRSHLFGTFANSLPTFKLNYTTCTVFTLSWVMAHVNFAYYPHGYFALFPHIHMINPIIPVVPGSNHEEYGKNITGIY